MQEIASAVDKVWPIFSARCERELLQSGVAGIVLSHNELSASENTWRRGV